MPEVNYQDWTDTQLTRQIAEMMGFRVEPADSGAAYIFPYVMFRRTSEGHRAGLVGARSEAEGWEMVPQFAADLNAAFMVAKHNPAYVFLNTQTTWASKSSPQSFSAEFFTCEGAGDDLLGRSTNEVSLARAICEAYLFWKQPVQV